VTKDGRRFRTVVEFPAGSPANPLPDAELIAKFRDLAGMALPRSQVDEIEDAILRIDMNPDTRALANLLSRAK